MIIKRDTYLNQLIAGKGNGLIKIITGIRRCGKSFLLFELFYNYLKSVGIDDDHIIKIAFDDWEYRDLCNPDHLIKNVKGLIKDEAPYYLLFDEVQLLDDFVPVLNSLLRKQNFDIYVTGSNSRFLSTDIVTEFRGRGDQVHVYPLSFSEFMSVSDHSVEESWKEYYTYGGLPLIRTLDGDQKKSDYLKNLYQTVYAADILERHKIRNKDEFNELVNIIASAIGSPTNPLKLCNTFHSLKHKKLTQPTISNYLRFLMDAFIIEKGIRYDIKGKKYINTLSKYYFTDIGVRNAILNFRQQEENHIMENIIYNELRIRGFQVDVGVVEHRTTDKQGKTIRKQYEVDFVVNKGSQRYYIQSAFRMPTETKVHQESASLMNIKDSFKKIIIVKDDIKPKRDEEGIITIGLFDFLLKGELLDW